VKVKDILYEVIPGLLPTDAILEMVSGISDPDISEQRLILNQYKLLLDSIPPDWLKQCSRKICFSQNEINQIKINHNDVNIDITKLTTKQLSNIVHSCRKMENPQDYEPTCINHWCNKFPDLHFKKSLEEYLQQR